MAEESSSVAELLAGVPLLAGLDPDELERIARVAVPRSFSKSERVFLTNHTRSSSGIHYRVFRREQELLVTVAGDQVLSHGPVSCP